MGERYGLTEQRFEQLKTVYGDTEYLKELVECWGAENCNYGYMIFDYDGSGMLCIQKIDELYVFEDDYEASEQAAKDGFKIIPVADLPDNMPKDLRFFGWVDTEENRQRIVEYCNEGGDGSVEIEVTHS